MARGWKPASGEWFESINPYTAQPWALIPRGGRADVDRRGRGGEEGLLQQGVAGTDCQRARCAAATACGSARRGGGQARRARNHRQRQACSQKCARSCTTRRNGFTTSRDWPTRSKAGFLPTDKPGFFNFTREEPLGVVAAITPWNSPLLLAAWKLAPALAAGNTVVLKPSEHSSVSALVFGELFEKAGFPPGVVNIITGFGNEVGEPLITHRDVAKVAFTGGDKTGQAVYEQAARSIKRVTLELGGKSANIVFDDADLDQAVNGVVAGIFAATGQTCIAGSRALIHRPIYDAFVERLDRALARSARMGNPLDLTTQVGPITTRPQYEKVLDYMQVAKSEGAVCLLGGGPALRPECGTGWFVEPTIFAGVRPEMRIANEEVFGPLLALIPFRR